MASQELARSPENKSSSFEISASGMRPGFQTWLRNTSKERLLTYCTVVIESGFATTIQEACVYLDEKVANFPKSLQAPTTTTSDLKGNRRSYLYPEFKRSQGKESNDISREPWSFGQISHRALLDLFSGKLPAGKFSAPPNLKKETTAPFGFAGDYISTHSINLLMQTVDLLAGRMQIFGLDPNSQKYINNLSNKLSQIFGRHLDDLVKQAPAIGIDRFVLTLMSWARAVEYSKTQPKRAFFTEIPIVPFEFDVWGGRPDALEVTLINGLPPTAEQFRILDRLSRYRYRSWIEIINEISKHFGNDFKAKPVDLKMAVGDGIPPTSVITPEEIPYPNHVRQMKTYIAFGTIGSMIAHGADKLDIWPDSSHFDEADLVYVLPGQAPIINKITLSLPEQRIYLRDAVAPRLQPGKTNAIVRITENAIIRHLLSVTSSRTIRRPPEAYTLPLPLTREETERVSISKIIEHFGKFEDPLKILEIIDKKYGDGQYWLIHADRLITGIRSGKVKYSNLQPGRSVFVQCLFSDHRDSGKPSMQVYFNDEKAFCHGCKRTAHFIAGSLPNDMQDKLPRIKFTESGQKNRRAIEIETPDSHHRVMKLAQELLQKTFWGKRGESYLAKNRGINPDLGYSLGVGYSSTDFIENMLKEGVSYEELYTLGFIRNSEWFDFYDREPRKYPRQFLDEILNRQGVKTADYMRKNNEGTGLRPYSVLFGRLCFPLTFLGKNTNFYGRATWVSSDRSKHRKLPKRSDIQVEQGGFNTAALYLPSKRKFLVEAGADALAGTELGLGDFTGFIGTANYAILEEAVHAGAEEIWLGMDNDDGGRDATARNKKYLEDMGYKGIVKDLNEELESILPEALKHDDLASYNKARKDALKRAAA